MTTEAVGKTLILASQSRSRRRMLEAAGLAFEVVVSNVDEPALKRRLEESGGPADPEDIATALASAKAVAVSRKRPEALVIGGDQVLALGARTFEKPPDMAAARRQLMELRGVPHLLVSSVVLAKNGQPVWQHAETAKLSMRAFSPTFLDNYLAEAGPDVCLSVGAYQLTLLGELRARGMIAT